MATFTITTAQNIDALTGKTGGDIYNVNGGALTIDQDSRFGLNNANTSATAATTMGSCTISATLGGTVNVDARYVRLIPFTGGSGTATAGATITVGSSTAKIIGIYSAINVAPVLTGVATGFIKVKQWNSVPFPTSGTYTQGGYTFTISGADKAGWIGLEGDEAATITVPRLGAYNMTGEWFEVGTTTAVRTTTYQLPTNGTNCYMPSVWVETAVGSGVFEAWHNAGTITALVANVPTDTTRGKVCWVTAASGLLRFGSDGTNSTGGALPIAGLRIRIPNIICNNTVATARNAVALPNATLATRYDFTTTGGGVINIDKVALNWYPSFAQAFSVQITNTAIAEQLLVSELASPVAWNNIVVGQSAAQAQFALSLALSFAGGTISNCIWSSASLAASGRYVVALNDLDGFTFGNVIAKSMVLRANATTGVYTATRVANCDWNNITLGGGQMLMVTCTNINVTNTAYYDTPAATTGTANPMYAFQLSTNCSNITLNGLTLPVTLNQPYSGILTAVTGSNKIKLRNIGTRSVPLDLGATNGSAYIYALGTGAAITDLKVQRVYTSTTRTGISTADNSSTKIVHENVFGDFADAPVYNTLNTSVKGLGGTPSLTAQTSVYGTHWFDCFTSATVGRIGIFMNEATSLTAGVYTIENGAAFTSAGGLYMPVIGHSATFETPYFVLGHTAFTNSAAIMGGGTATNYNYNFAVNKNDGAGWSTMTTANYTATTLGTALAAVTGIDASKGIKLRLKITTITTNTTAITSVYVPTVSSAAAQAFQYPLDQITLSLTGLLPGTDVVILQAGTSTIIDSVDEIVGTSYSYVYSTIQSVDIGFLKAGYKPFYIRNYMLDSVNSSIPVAQQVDRSYV